MPGKQLPTTGQRTALLLAPLCGCTDFQAAGPSIVAGALGYLLVTVLANYLIAWVYDRRSPRARWRARVPSAWLLIGLHVAGSVWGLQHLDPAHHEPMLVVGCSHLTISLLLWRLLRWRLVHSASLGSLLVLVPALVIHALNKIQVILLSAFWLSTYSFGFAPVLVFVGLLLEARVNGHPEAGREPEPRDPDLDIAREFD